MLTDRHWKEPEWAMVELIANILQMQGYAERKMTAGYIAPAAGGLNEMVCPFYNSDDANLIRATQDQERDVARELSGRKQADAIENWLRTNEADLLRQAKHCTEPIPYDGRQKRIARIQWCLNKLAEEL